MERIATVMGNNAESVKSHNQNLFDKIDILTTKIATVNPYVPVRSDNELDKIANKIDDKSSQLKRSEDLSEYYTELLNKTVTYAPRKFRTISNRNSPEYEKHIHIDDTYNTANKEI